MQKIVFEEINLIGLSLKVETSNERGKSSIDCGNLWQRFEKENYAAKITHKLSNDILAVYHNYTGDHTGSFSYFIGCKVEAGSNTPEGLDRLKIPGGLYQKMISRGKMPDCLSNTWKEIWQSHIPRSYQSDFEVYDDRSKDWNNATVDIYISIEH